MGGWSDWVNETGSKSCGQGTMRQTRICTNPTPRNDGANCNGNSTKFQSYEKTK